MLFKKNITEIIKSENGSVLGMVLIFFLVMTIIGTAFLTMASQETILFEKELDRAKAFRMAESGINIALWRINSGPDLYGSFSNDSLSVTYDSTAMILSSTGISGSHQQTISVNLFIDSPFNHIISYTNTLNEGNYSLDHIFGHETKTFDELPELDLNYYIDIADHIYSGDDNDDDDDNKKEKENQKKDDDDVTEFKNITLSGINVVLGDVEIKNGVHINGTIIATGSIKFSGHAEIHAQQIPNTTAYYPALVALEEEIWGNPNLIVTGAIYCSNKVSLRGESISGPIIAKNIKLQSNVNITDEGSEKYYSYPPGWFEDEDYNKYIVIGSWSYND